MVIHATGAQTHGEMFQAEGIVRPGGFAGAPHVHPLQEERFVVTQGTAGFRVGRKRVRLEAGGSARRPGRPGPHVLERRSRGRCG